MRVNVSITESYDDTSLSAIQLEKDRHLQENIGYYQKGENRDQVFFENLVYYYDYLGLDGKKIYSYLGSYHVFQYKVNGNSPFSAKVKQSELSFANKMTSLNFLMNDSYMVMPSNQLPEFMR